MLEPEDIKDTVNQVAIKVATAVMIVSRHMEGTLTSARSKLEGVTETKTWSNSTWEDFTQMEHARLVCWVNTLWMEVTDILELKAY